MEYDVDLYSYLLKNSDFNLFMEKEVSAKWKIDVLDSYNLADANIIQLANAFGYSYEAIQDVKFLCLIYFETYRIFTIEDIERADFITPKIKKTKEIIGEVRYYEIPTSYQNHIELFFNNFAKDNLDLFDSKDLVTFLCRIISEMELEPLAKTYRSWNDIIYIVNTYCDNLILRFLEDQTSKISFQKEMDNLRSIKVK